MPLPYKEASPLPSHKDVTTMSATDDFKSFVDDCSEKIVAKEKPSKTLKCWTVFLGNKLLTFEIITCLFLIYGVEMKLGDTLWDSNILDKVLEGW